MWHLKDVKYGISAYLALTVFLIFKNRCCKGEGGGRLIIRIVSHSGQNCAHTVSTSLLLVEIEESTEWVRIYLAVVGVLAYFFNLRLSFRILTPGMMPISPCSTSMINNPLHLCSFYRNNWETCLTNFATCWRAPRFRLIVCPALPCILIGCRCGEQRRPQQSKLKRFSGLSLERQGGFPPMPCKSTGLTNPY